MVAASAVAEREIETLTNRVTERIREITHGRVRDLEVEEVRGDVIVRGVVKSHHLRQLALQGALEVVDSGRCRPLLTVG